MQFNKIYITKQGKEIFANVNSGTSKLIWTNIYSSSKSIEVDDSSITPDNIASKDVFSNSNRTGSGKITAIQNGNTAQLSCRLENTTYSGIANCIGLYAHIEGQTDTLMIYAILDGADPVTIPSTDSEPFLALINVNMTLSDVAVTSFEADADWYASSKALQEETEARNAFDDRCVTTHTASSSTTGEDQTIYGEKTFVQTTKHKNDILPTESNKINLGSSTLKWKNIYATAFTGNVTGDLNGNATTATTATNLSTVPSLSWINATGVSDGSTLTITAGRKTSTAATITTVRQAYRPYVSSYSANSPRPLVFTSSTTAGFKDLYTDTDNSLYYNPSTNTLTCSTINISSIVTDNAKKQLIIEPANVDVSGTTNTELAIHPDSDNYCWLGTPNKRFYKMYAGSFYGTAFYGRSSVKGNSTNKSYPLIFAESVNTKTDEWEPQTLYTDTVNSLYYNPSTNTLTCDNLNGKITIDSCNGSYNCPIVFVQSPGNGTQQKLCTTSTIKCYFRPNDSTFFTDNLYVTNYCKSSLRPDVNNTYSLGMPATRWSTLYCDNINTNNFPLYDVILEVKNPNSTKVHFGTSNAELVYNSSAGYYTCTAYVYSTNTVASQKVNISIYSAILETKKDRNAAAGFDVADATFYNTHIRKFKFLNGNIVAVPGNATEYIRCLLLGVS